MYFSSDERLAGQEAGKKMKADGADQDPLHHPAGRVGRPGGPLRRCQGQLPQHREHPGERRRRLGRHFGAPGQAESGQGHRLDHHPRRTAGPGRPEGLRGCRQLGEGGTFDLNPDAAQAMKDGKIQFSIDQQPYVQGYMAVTRSISSRRTATTSVVASRC